MTVTVKRRHVMVEQWQFDAEIPDMPREEVVEYVKDRYQDLQDAAEAAGTLDYAENEMHTAGNGILVEDGEGNEF